MRHVVTEKLVRWNSVIRSTLAEQAGHATRGKPGNLRRTGTFAAFPGCITYSPFFVPSYIGAAHKQSPHGIHVLLNSTVRGGS
jgi:hypothetical protein